jgi:hypothetical protein
MADEPDKSLRKPIALDFHRWFIKTHRKLVVRVFLLDSDELE